MKTLVTVLTVLLCGTAFAQTRSLMRMQPAVSASQPEGMWVFGSINGGSLGNLDNEETVNIDQMGVRAAASMYSPTMVTEVGLGFFRFDNEEVDLQTDTPMVDAMASYRFRETWHAGPILSTTLSHARDLGSSDDTLAPFIGLGVFKDFAINRENLVRVGLKGMTDVSIPAQTVNSVALELQFGGSPGMTQSTYSRAY